MRVYKKNTNFLLIIINNMLVVRLGGTTSRRICSEEIDVIKDKKKQQKFTQFTEIAKIVFIKAIVKERTTHAH